MQDRYQSKVTTSQRAAEAIQSGDRVLISGGVMQPGQFLAALSARQDLRRVTLCTGMTLVPPDLLVRQYTATGTSEILERNIRWTSFCPGPGTRAGVSSGVVDFVPIPAQRLGASLAEQRFDVIVVGSSGLDPQGNFNLGASVDWMGDVLSRADLSDTLVIVEVNPEWPKTAGPASLSMEQVDQIVESSGPPVDLPAGEHRPEAKAIGGFLNALVTDGATLQIGQGELVSQAASFLDGKRDLGLHSELIGDVALFLHNRGAMTGRRKLVMEGRMVGSYVLGTRKLYDFVNGNSKVVLHPCEFIARPTNILRNGTVFSLTQGLCVDLSGQVAAQSAGFEFGDHASIQRTFHATAALSPGGAGIVVLPTPKGGRSSNVVDAFSPGLSVTIPREDIDVVVSEFGIARLRNKSLSERALALISIAHPRWRDELAGRARSAGLL